MKKPYLNNNLLTLIFIAITIASCDVRKVETEQYSGGSEEESSDARMTNIQGAAEFEFNMLKDPATGVIPAGAREMEMAQARTIMTTPRGQMSPDVNPYVFQGPNNLGGRTRSVAYDVRFNGSTNQVIIAGGISGGVYKSVDNGATWTRKSPTGDLFNVSTLVQDTRAGQEDTWYYAGGEFLGNSAGATGASYRGKGIYKSTDNGETWSWLPNSNDGVYESFDRRTDYIAKLAVDPTNGNVYAAAVDGIYQSTDGGVNWGIVLTSGSGSFSSNYITDIVVTPSGRLYAAFSGFSPTSPNMPGVWTSTSGNSGTWIKIAGTGSATTPAGWNSDGGYGRVVLALAPSDPDLLFALYYSANNSCPTGIPEGELWRWEQSITTWTALTVADEGGCLSGNDPFSVQTGYDLVIGVKPDDANTIFIGGTNIYRSTNGGATIAGWTRIGGYNSNANYALYPNSHPDIHAMAFQPGSPDIMLCGNDGGIQRTANNLAGSVSWTPLNTGYRTYQFYYVDVDPRDGVSKVIGGAQDNGTTRNIGSTGTDFESIWGGDGVSVALSGTTLLEYGGSQSGSIVRRPEGLATGFAVTITPTGEAGSGLFVTLFKLDSDNPNYLYYANDNLIYRTTSAPTVTSGTWTAMTGVSGTVTPATVDITALALTRGTYSASTASLFFGTSDGRLFRLDDPANVAAATAPVNITGVSFPAGGYVSGIAVNPRNDDTVVVTFSNYGVSSAFWTGNANSVSPTWTNVEGNISLSSFRTVAIHAVPNSPQVRYFVGTSTGLYTNMGLPVNTTWTKEGATEIGDAVVSHLAYRPGDGFLLAGTHGYGMWSTMLNLTPLPVELTTFSGNLQGRFANLQWVTAAEYNSSHFELERSIDGIQFSKIATMPAAGTSNSQRSYGYLDKGPLTEYNFYRLRSIDLDGSYKVSNTVVVKLSNAGQDVIVMGNPFITYLDLKLIRSPADAGEVRLTGTDGRLVMVAKIARGQQQIRLTAPPSLKPGTYILEVVIDKKRFTRKLIRQ